MSSYPRRFRSLPMRTTNYSRTTHGIRRCTSRRSGGCGLPALASTIEPQPWRMVPTSSGSGLGITANTTDSLAVSNRNETPNHALQRTGAAVTPAASAAAFPSAAQRSRQPRPSLSLGSLGVATRVVFNGAFSPVFPYFMSPTSYLVVAPRSGSRFPVRHHLSPLAVHS